MKSRSGFTIVELLIVIVVIAILAAISIVAYNGIQQRARDTQRKQDVATIVKGLGLYGADKGAMHTGSGCGAGGSGNGYFDYTYSPWSSMSDCLKVQGYLTQDVKDPNNVPSCTTNDTGCRKYMKYSCMQGSAAVTYVYANLEGVAHTSTDTDGTCSAALDTTYGMNYFVKVTH